MREAAGLYLVCCSQAEFQLAGRACSEGTVSGRAKAGLAVLLQWLGSKTQTPPPALIHARDARWCVAHTQMAYFIYIIYI